VIGAKTLVTLTLLAIGVVAAASFGVLAPERLLSRGWGTLFFVGCFAVVVGTLMFRFWRLGEPSLHYFRWSTKTTHWSAAEEAHFVGGEGRRVALGDNRGEAFDLGPRLHRVVCVALALLLALACIDARSLGLLDRFQHSVGNTGATYCPDPETQPVVADPNVPGCELMRRAYALGYVKNLGQCTPKAQRAAAATVAPCTRRQRDEPALHYAWRLLKGSWGKLSAHADASYVQTVQHDFGKGVDKLERGDAQMLASASHASHHLWTNLPDPGLGGLRADSCGERYRWMAHRPAPTGERRASQVLDHVLGQLLFEIRYEPAAGTCREFHVHWGAPLDACKRLAANPEGALSAAGALGDVRAVLERDRAGREPVQRIVSFQCYFEGEAAAPTSTPFTFAGQPFTVDEVHVAPSPADAALYIDRYDAVARLLVRGFHYGALMSEAGVEPGSAAGMQAAFGGHDFLLTRLYGLDSADIYLDAGWIAQRPDLLEVYPYERHLRNYVQLFRRQYARVRGRL
jgi:hypothetical protein